jgi:general secretion pathway protein A
VGLISNTHASFRSIHPWAVSALGIAPRDDSDIAQYEALVDFLIREYGKGRRSLLIVDEAHNLSTPILEELRLLSNVNSEQDLALQVFLVGQPELRSKLEHPALEQFAQRVSVDFHLGSLTLQEAREYITHRLTVAGGDPALFQAEAIAFVHARTGGIPRLINQLCDLALVYGFAEQSSTIDLPLLQHVLQDRKHRGAIALFAGRAASSAVDAGIGSNSG